MERVLVNTVIVFYLIYGFAEAQPESRTYVGAVAGISTLSADGRSENTANGVDVSLYKPENGPAANVFWGIHLHEYVSIQANYIWNRNDVALISVRATEGSLSSYEQPRSSSQHAVIGDLLVFFRGRRSIVRPYLSAGLGSVRLETKATGTARSRNSQLPAAKVSAARAPLRVAVGIDVVLGRRWRGRYSFSESISGNPIGSLLSPPGQRNLANFQNLFGIVREL
jgi:hypothetical protein